MKKFIKNNKWLLLFSIVFYITIFYCCLNTFIISDDLHYSFYLHNGERITNIFQIIKNQIYDYSHYNARLVVHFIVQFLLIWGKKLWYILNPLVILIGLYYFAKIIQLKTQKKVNIVFYMIASAICFLLLYERRSLIYWVAGSVNYTWVFTVLIIYLYYYLTGKLENKTILNMAFILFFSSLHECTMVMMVIFVLGNIILKCIKDKKLNKKILLYLIPLFIGILFTILSPGNQYRQGLNVEWNSLSLIEKIMKSLPVVSYNLFKLDYIYCLFPILYITSIIINLFKNKNIKSKICILIILINAILCLLIKNNWLYVLLAVVLFIVTLIQFIKEKDYKMLILLIMFYANGFFIILTPEYLYGRVNYHTHLFMGLYAFISFYNIDSFDNIIKCLSTIFVFILLLIEVNVYHEIGSVIDDRMQAVMRVQNKETNILEVKQLDYKYCMFHIDCNSPDSEDYWAYNYYLKYYNLDNNTKVKVVK